MKSVRLVQSSHKRMYGVLIKLIAFEHDLNFATGKIKGIITSRGKLSSLLSSQFNA